MDKKERKMTQRERLNRVFEGREADRTPILGGWIAYVDHILHFADATIEEYDANPKQTAIKAYRNLGMDGLADLLVPINKDKYRIIDHETYSKAETVPLEKCIEDINNMPSPEKAEEMIDFELEYAEFKSMYMETQALCDEMVFMPGQWKAGAKLDWYLDIGYQNYFMIVGMYPKEAQKLMELGGVLGKKISKIIARAVTEGIFPKALLMGGDICTQRGPMISPDFLEKHFAPQLKEGLKPLLEVGCRPVWHCDGDCRLLLDMLLDCGIQGFQGFQPECGMTLEHVITKKTKDNKPLLIFGPMSVTSELPVYTPGQIKRKVWDAVEMCRGSADLVLFTSNTINPDVPVENIRAMYEAVSENI